MKVLSINISQPIEIQHKDRKVSTGIFKTPVTDAVVVTELGLEGDGQADRENHGGIDKAIYAYSIENFRYWEKTLDRKTMPFGHFGENLTVESMPDNRVHIGDIFKVGDIEVQVTQPRVPCFKLGIKMEMDRFPKIFMTSGRTGFYLRVLQGGLVDKNDKISLIHEDPGRLAIDDAMLALVKGPRQRQNIERALAIPALSKAWQTDLAKRLKP